MLKTAPLTLDEKINSLVPGVQPTLRSELRKLLGMVRELDYPEGVLDIMTRSGLQLTAELYDAYGMTPPNDNLFSRLEDATGQGILPGELNGYLHMIRSLSNKPHHAAENVKLRTEDAEIVLRSFLRVLEWYYCDCERGPRLKTIYRQGTGTVDRQTIVGLCPADVAAIFQDRATEAEKIRSLLSDRAVKLTSIVGRKGMGKTALLSKICAEIERGELRLATPLHEGGVDGLIYYNCGPDTPTVERLFHDMGLVLGSPHAEELAARWNDAARSFGDKVRFLLSKLRDGYYLVVLDGAQSMLNDQHRFADAEVYELVALSLATAHGLRWLVTSQERIVVDGDGVQSARTVALHGGLPESDAIALLRAYDPDGELGLRDAADDVLQEAAASCYGIPHALQVIRRLLSPHGSTLSLEEIIQNPARFRGEVVESLLAEYFRQIPEEQRRVLEALAIYNRPVDIPAVRYLLEPFGAAERAQPCLQDLRLHFAVTYRNDCKAFELLPIDSQYLYEAIPERGGAYSRHALHERAAGYYASRRKPAEERQALPDLDAELEQFRHLRKAARYDEACRVLNEIDETLKAWGHYGLIRNLRTVLKNNVSEPRLQVANLNALGYSMIRLREVEAAVALLEEALRIARTHVDREGEGEVLNTLGIAALAHWDIGAAIHFYQQAVEIAEEQCAGRNLGILLSNFGEANAHRGAIDTAMQMCRRGIEIGERIGDAKVWRANVNDLGLAYLQTGDTATARHWLTQALASARHHASRHSEAVCLGRLGRCAALEGDFDAAIRYAVEAIEIQRASGNLWGVAVALPALGRAYQHAGNAEAARAAYEEAIGFLYPYAESTSLMRLGVLQLQQGQHDTALVTLQRAIEMTGGLLAKTPQLVDARLDLALGQLAIGEHQDAFENVRQATAGCAAKGILRVALQDFQLLEQATGQGLEEVITVLESATAP
jgi:tetratricopeptide (TPR) repeat protein